MVSEIMTDSMTRCSVLFSADSKTLKEEKREELFENLKADDSIGWDVDVIDPKELSAKMLKKSVKNLRICICLFCSLLFLLISSCYQQK